MFACLIFCCFSLSLNSSVSQLQAELSILTEKYEESLRNLKHQQTIQNKNDVEQSIQKQEKDHQQSLQQKKYEELQRSNEK